MINLRKALNLLLATSLLLNFAMGAFLLTQNIRNSIAASLTSDVATAYPPSFLQAYREALRSNWRNLRDLAQELEDARARQHEAMTAETFDRAAFEQAQVELRAAQVSLILTLQDPLADALEALPDDVRRTLPLVRLSASQTQSVLDRAE